MHDRVMVLYDDQEHNLSRLNQMVYIQVMSHNWLLSYQDVGYCFLHPKNQFDLNSYFDEPKNDVKQCYNMKNKVKE